MRVALVCPSSWTVPGGVQTHVAGLRAALIRLGHEVDVIARVDGPAPEWLLPAGRSIPIRDNGSVQRVAARIVTLYEEACAA
jgi:phosphatidylinositol alpha-mannosyltransferase